MNNSWLSGLLIGVAIFVPFQGPEKYMKKKVPGNLDTMAHFNPKLRCP